MSDTKTYTFRYDPEGHRSPGHNVAIGTVEPGKTYKVGYADALGLRQDPDFTETTKPDAQSAAKDHGPKSPPAETATAPK